MVVQEDRPSRIVETRKDLETAAEHRAISGHSAPVSATETNRALSIRLFGGFRLAVGSRVVEESAWSLRKTKNLIKMLALAPGHKMHRGELMDLLWPEFDLQAAANNLHKALHLLRRVLEPDLRPKARSSYVHLQNDFVVLDPPGALRIDVEAFEEAAALAMATQDLAAYEEALRLYTGDLLPEDRYEDWVIRRRETLHTVLLDLLFELAQLQEMGGDADAAIDALRKVVTLEPAHEEAHAGLMRLFAGSGQRHLALRQYRQLRDAMRRDLDAEPDTSTQALHREILRSTAPLAAPADGQIVRSQRQLIGREDELAHLDECLSLLQQEQGGLVLVRGEGGIGKSRLVAEVMDRAGQLGITTLWDVPEASTDPDSSSFAAMLERLDNWSHASALRPRPTATATDFATISRANSTLLPSRDSTEAAPQRLSVAVDDFSWRPDVRSPVLIVIDDLHLASDVNPDLLYQLAEKGQYGPILFVGAFRPEEVLPGSSLDRLVRALEREAPERILEVNPLSFSHTESLVLELLGGPVDRAVVETVYELADGNPYFTQEATEALRGRGQISYSQGMWRLQAGPVMVWGREYLRQPDSRSKAASLTSYMRAS